MFLSVQHSHTRLITEVLVLSYSFCRGSTLWKSCLHGVQLAGRTAPFHPRLPRKKLVSKPRSPETAPTGEEVDHGIIREGAGSLQSSLCSLASWPGCVSWSLLKEGSSPGRISLFLLARLHRWERSTSKSQGKILRASFVTIVRVVGFSFAGSYAGDTVAGLCVVHQRYHTAFILDQKGLRFLPL